MSTHAEAIEALAHNDIRLDPSERVKKGALVADYDAWSDGFKFPTLNLNNFSKALTRLLGPPKRTKRGRYHPLLLKSRTER